MKQITVGETVRFHVGVNDTAGSGADGATCVWDVRLAGAAAGAAPVLSGSGTLLSHANFPAGCYEIEIAATVGNDFAANESYAVFASLAVDAQNPTGLVGEFETESTGSATTHFSNQTTNAYSTVQSLNGDYIVHITGTFASATLRVWGGTYGQDPLTFQELLEVAAASKKVLTYAGDLRFEVLGATGSTSISAVVQEIVR